jgi:hypothetical protein
LWEDLPIIDDERDRGGNGGQAQAPASLQESQQFGQDVAAAPAFHQGRVVRKTALAVGTHQGFYIPRTRHQISGQAMLETPIPQEGLKDRGNQAKLGGVLFAFRQGRAFFQGQGAGLFDYLKDGGKVTPG